VTRGGTGHRGLLAGAICIAAALSLAPAGASASPHAARAYAASPAQTAGERRLVRELAAHEVSVKAQGAYQASPVISADGHVWLVLEGADGAYGGTNSSVTASPYPDGTVKIYRWSASGWSEQAAVRGFFGPIGGCCGIAAASLTGSHDPDFTLTGGGAADTNWFSVVSDAGGSWHAVRFAYGYSTTTVVNAYAVEDRRIETAVDASSSAAGPTTLLFESYQDGEFRPAPPPARPASCSRAALQLAADPGELAVLTLSKFACADGWAMAIGTGAGFTGQVVALFEQARAKWNPIEVDNGDSLGSYPGIYDLPLTLLRQLAAGFGPAVAPALATASLIAERPESDALYVNGVIAADGGDWYLTETLTGSAESPGADAQIYRWSGSAWVQQGHVDNVPHALNYFYALSGGWFEPVTVAGTSDPGFKMDDSGTPSAPTLTNAGGTWHVSGR
jgi:hypothetical protein